VKKITVILVFALVSVFSAGSFFIYKSFLSSYKSDMRTYIKTHKKNLTTSVISILPSELYVNTKTITWEDNNKEIIYEGNLYDVISISSENQKMLITITSDQAEEDIQKQFAAAYDFNTQSSGNPLKLLKQFLGLKFLSDTFFDFNPFDSLFSSQNYSIYAAHFKAVFLSIETPPPIH
jgi:hypothetical protein